MTSRDRVINTLYKQTYQPIPTLLTFPAGILETRPGECRQLRERFHSDVDFLDYFYYPVAQTPNHIDPWGCLWTETSPGRFHIVGETVLCQNFDQLNDLRIPLSTPSAHEIERINQYCEKNSRFVVAQIPVQPITRLLALLGKEKTYVGLRKMQKDVMTFLTRLHEVYLQELDAWLQTDVDAICLGRHWMCDKNFIPPLRWDDIFTPLLREYCEKIRRHDKFVYYSGIDHFEETIPSLIQAGVDVIRYDCSQIDSGTLVERYGHQVTFHAIFPTHKIPTDDLVSEVILDIRRKFQDCGLIAECQFQADTSYRRISSSMLNWRRRIPAEISTMN
ncbi:MAG: hypothetical protein Q4D62_09710 [Planctomycetia bacterium]|nr:hypothetical protein [Planctomycetia bacterium]